MLHVRHMIRRSELCTSHPFTSLSPAPPGRYTALSIWKLLLPGSNISFPHHLPGLGTVLIYDPNTIPLLYRVTRPQVPQQDAIVFSPISLSILQ